MRLGTMAAGAALALGACNGSTGAEPSPAPSPPPAVTPSPSPSPAFSPSPTEVLPANDVNDPVAALEAIVRYRDHLFENPDPEKLSLIYAERCSCYEEVYEVLAAFAEDGRHIEVSEQRYFEFVEVLDRSGPAARVAYRVGTPSLVLRSADGSTLAERAAEAPKNAEAFLVSEDGRWRVVALVEES